MILLQNYTTTNQQDSILWREIRISGTIANRVADRTPREKDALNFVQDRRRASSKEGSARHSHGKPAFAAAEHGRRAQDPHRRGTRTLLRGNEGSGTSPETMGQDCGHPSDCRICWRSLWNVCRHSESKGAPAAGGTDCGRRTRTAGKRARRTGAAGTRAT